jgi:hypothetical protein
MSAASDETVSVGYATRNGSARLSDNDYVAASGRLEFPPGETTMTIAVEIKGDSKREQDEFFYLDLFDADGASIKDSRGTGWIRNDDRR